LDVTCKADILNMLRCETTPTDGEGERRRIRRRGRTEVTYGQTEKSTSKATDGENEKDEKRDDDGIDDSSSSYSGKWQL